MQPVSITYYILNNGPPHKLALEVIPLQDLLKFLCYTLHHTCYAIQQRACMQAAVSPPFAFHSKSPCICPDSPMPRTCRTLSPGSRPTHRFRASMIRPGSCSLACVVWRRGTRLRAVGERAAAELRGAWRAPTWIPPRSVMSDAVHEARLAATALQPLSNSTAFTEVVPTSTPRM